MAQAGKGCYTQQENYRFSSSLPWRPDQGTSLASETTTPSIGHGRPDCSFVQPTSTRTHAATLTGCPAAPNQDRQRICHTNACGEKRVGVCVCNDNDQLSNPTVHLVNERSYCTQPVHLVQLEKQLLIIKWPLTLTIVPLCVGYRRRLGSYFQLLHDHHKLPSLHQQKTVLHSHQHAPRWPVKSTRETTTITHTKTIY